MSSETIGVIGLGLMGSAITERLLIAGYRVCVTNRTREKADPLIKIGARWSDNPLDECDRVLISLYTTGTVNEVLGQLDGGLRPGQILVDTTTGDCAQTAELADRLMARGVQYLDAPISGSSQQTRDAQATTIVGGDRETLNACRDLLDCWSAKIIHAGPCGSGSAMKLVSNLVLGLNRAALAEGLVFAESLGLDATAALDLLRNSMAHSRIMDTKGEKMIRGDFSAQARLAQHGKDIRLMLDAAGKVGQQLPLSEVHARLHDLAEEAGWGDQDNSAIIEAIRQSQDSVSKSNSTGKRAKG